MKQADLDYFRKTLDSLIARLRGDAESMAEQARSASGGNGNGELSNAPLHLGDMGTEEYLYDLNATLLENEQYLIEESRAALRRIEEGQFGRCLNCGGAIVKERLRAMPYTRFCIRCAETMDQTPEVNLNEGRPLRPVDTLAPEGEMGEDRPAWHDPLEQPPSSVPRGDIHAAGTAGGGTAIGGLAGTNEGRGDPVIAEVQEATASGDFDAQEDRDQGATPRSGRSGGAVGGTPAGKRVK